MEITDKRVAVLVLEMKDFIADEVRAKSVAIGPEVEVEDKLVKDWDVEDVKMRMG